MSIIKNVIPHSHEAQDNSGHTHPIADGYFSQKNFTQAKSDKLNNIEANAEVNVNADWSATSGDAEILNKPTDVTDLTGHNADELSDISSAGSGAIITTSERTKLTGIESGATQNDTDANLKNRANHTGEQAISSVTGLQTALDGKVDDSQVLTNVPSNAVFTDTTYIVADNQLSEKNFTTALHTKLTGVEAGATADQTASEIKTAYESNADTNAFTNAEQSKLSGIDDSANNYTLPAASGSLGGIVSGSGGDVTVDGSGVVTVLDDSHNHVISNVDGLQAALDAKVDDSQVLTNVPANAVFTDTTYSDATTSVSGLMSGADKTKLDGLTGAEVNVNADWNATSGDAEILNKPTTITSAEQAKLGHISVTQAVDLDTMESDIATNTAKVTNATHTGDVTGATALTISNDAVTNAKMANVATGTVKGRTAAGTGDVEDLDIDTTLKAALNLTLDDSAETTTNKHFTDTDQTKLNGIESEATADQTDAEIKTAYENNANTNAFTDAEKTKLSGIETGADVTDSTNVSAAGALMKTGGTMTGELQVNARLDVGNGSGNNTEIRIYKNDNNISDHLQFYNGTTRVGEIGVQDTTWLRINQETNKNVFTPRMIRADGGFQVDGSNVITGSGVHTGNGSALTSLNASNISSGTLNKARLPASATFGDGISTDGSDVYTDNGAFIAKDDSGDFADRTGSNIDHIWHDDTNNAWNFCSDTTYKGEGNSELKAKGLHIKSTGDARIFIEADSDNVTETDNAYIKMTQDGGVVGSILGLCPASNKDPENQTYTGASSNGLLIGTTYSGASINFGTNNSGTKAVRLSIKSDGDVEASTKLRVNGASSYNNVTVNARGVGNASSEYIYYGENSSGSGRFGIRASDGTVWSSSDKRWKKNIESMSNLLNKVCECVLSKFHFRNQKDSELKSIGFISQEIEPIFPELVENLPDGYKSINYDRFGAIALQAIKELREEKDAQIKKLEARIETLEAKL